MAADTEDPREHVLHPRFAEAVVGHERAIQHFKQAVEQGRPHHAWLLTGKEGIGKATLSYAMARLLLSEGNRQASKLIDARSHPDLFVLQRQTGTGKTLRLKTEISVEDSRLLGDFFARTAGMGKWRCAIIDTVDDLNTESANALLKLLEEPPPNCLLFLVCHQPGRVLRTIRSRCLQVQLSPLAEDQLHQVFNQKRFRDAMLEGDIELAIRLSGGSAGRALALLTSVAAKAFALLHKTDITGVKGRHAVMSAMGARSPAAEDFGLFVELLLGHVAEQAKANASSIVGQRLSEAHGAINTIARRTDAFNLDRKIAVLESLVVIDRALRLQPATAP